MSTTDGGPAFPSLDIYEGWDSDHKRYEVKSDTATGMSLRDYFAAHAMQDVFGHFKEESIERAASFCYLVADAMLKAREGQQ